MAAGEPAASPSSARSSEAVSIPSGMAPARLIDDVEWVGRGGERALKVTPATALRAELNRDVVADAWRRVVRAVPAADTPGMRDQFVCHAYFAPGKEAWYLEPARPDVGYWRTVLAGCNPGDVIDVG